VHRSRATRPSATGVERFGDRGVTVSLTADGHPIHTLVSTLLYATTWI
jgi:hypothetical protein